MTGQPLLKSISAETLNANFIVVGYHFVAYIKTIIYLCDVYSYMLL